MVAMNPSFFQGTDRDQIVQMPRICSVLFEFSMVAEAILFVSAVQLKWLKSEFVLAFKNFC